jgi:hypothetical protein
MRWRMWISFRRCAGLTSAPRTTGVDFGARYYIFQMAFADTSAELSLGQGTHGGQLPVILIREPGDGSAALPGALTVDSPTRYLSILRRILFRPETPMICELST